jgi:hypothetical protein
MNISMCIPGELADAKGIEHLKNREWTADELVAVVRLQKVWRGYYARKIRTARTPGMSEQ